MLAKNILMTSAVSALVAFAGFTATAKADGLYEGSGSMKDTAVYEATPMWSGMYIGFHGGWAQGAWDGELQYNGEPASDAYQSTQRELDGEGWHGGLQIGANHQVNSLVLGIELDASYSDFGGVETYATDKGSSAGMIDGGFAKKHDFSMDWFGTARVRAGYSAGYFMPYVTGGLAFARTEGNLQISYPHGTGSGSPTPCCGVFGETSNANAEESHLGWTVGGGVETILGAGWSLKAEYLHVDLGEQDYNFRGKVFNGADFNTDSFESDLTFDVFRAGMNYRF